MKNIFLYIFTQLKNINVPSPLFYLQRSIFRHNDCLLSVGNPAANRAAALRVLSMATDVIKALVPLACRQDNILIRMVAELLGLFCTIGKFCLKSHMISF